MNWSDSQTDVDLATRHTETVLLLAEAAADRAALAEDVRQSRASAVARESEAETLRRQLEEATAEVRRLRALAKRGGLLSWVPGRM